MNLLFCQILQKYQDIKYMMKETWIKLVTLEKSVLELRSTKMPLILYVDKESGDEITLFNVDSCKSKKDSLPSVMELMKHMGYNVHRPSWQVSNIEPSLNCEPKEPKELEELEESKGISQETQET